MVVKVLLIGLNHFIFWRLDQDGYEGSVSKQSHWFKALRNGLRARGLQDASWSANVAGVFNASSRPRLVGLYTRNIVPCFFAFCMAE
jgi:hypothetical protein